MFIEGFIGNELNRIRNVEYHRNSTRLAPQPVPRRSHSGNVRFRIGAALIRTGAGMAGVRVDDCLDAATAVSPARI